MYDPPTMTELVTSVREFIEEHAMPQLEGRSAFHARVAANALAIVERQLQLAPEAEAAEQARLIAVLGRPGGEEADLEGMTRELCRRIRAGELGVDSPGLVEHLHRTTLDKLAVDQPRYSGYRRALARDDD